jgi:hypothetical protein
MAPEQVLGTRMKEPGVSLVQSRKRRSAVALSFAAVGALSFWLPDIAIHAHAGPNLDSRHAWAITVFASAVFLLAYVVARRFALKTKFKRLGPTLLLGVWVSGGLFMTISALVSGSDFIGGTGLWRLAIIPMSIVPIVTFILASYDGSLFALVAITLGGLLICGVRANCTLWSSKDTGNIAVRTPKEIEGPKAA